MSHADRLKKSPSSFRQLTGLTPAAFDALLADLAPRYEAAEAKRKARPGRKRKPGGGRKFALPLSDRLLMLLIYYRTYVAHAFLAFLFGVDQSSVCRNINPLQPLLAGIFRIPERRADLTEGEVHELFFDCTEQPVNRPGPGRRQRAYYSGKKKRHTLKHQVVVARRRKKPGPHPGGVPRPRSRAGTRTGPSACQAPGRTGRSATGATEASGASGRPAVRGQGRSCPHPRSRAGPARRAPPASAGARPG